MEYFDSRLYQRSAINNQSFIRLDTHSSSNFKLERKGVLTEIPSFGAC